MDYKSFMRITEIRTKIFIDYPKLYEIMDYVDVIEDNTQETMLVTPKDENENHFIMKYNSDFVEDLTDTELQGVFMHEMLHLIFKHITTRYPQDIRDEMEKAKEVFKTSKDMLQKLHVKNRIDKLMEKWNIATDAAINQMLRPFFKARGKGKGQMKVPPVYPANVGLHDGYSAEHYYNELKKGGKDMEDDIMVLEIITSHDGWDMKQDLEQCANPGQSDKKDKEDKEKDEKEEKAQGGKGDGKKEDGEDDKEGSKGSGKSDEEKEEQEKKEKLERVIDEILEHYDLKTDKDREEEDKKAEEDEDSEDESGEEDGEKNLEKDEDDSSGDGGEEAGDGTGEDGYEINIDAFGPPQELPLWERDMKGKSFHGINSHREATRKKVNRRFGITYPGYKVRQDRNEIAVYVDKSGSMNQYYYDDIMAKVKTLFKYADFILIFFNGDLQEQIKFNGGPIKFRKGGGTDFEPVIEHWNANHKKFAAGYIFTDGQANYQTKPLDEKNLNWLLYGSKRKQRHGNSYFM